MIARVIVCDSCQTVGKKDGKVVWYFFRAPHARRALSQACGWTYSPNTDLCGECARR